MKDLANARVAPLQFYTLSKSAKIAKKMRNEHNFESKFFLEFRDFFRKLPLTVKKPSKTTSSNGDAPGKYTFIDVQFIYIFENTKKICSKNIRIENYP